MKSVCTRFVFAFTTILLVNVPASSEQLPMHEPDQEALRQYLLSLTVDDVTSRVTPNYQMPQHDIDRVTRYHLWMLHNAFRYLGIGTVKQKPADFMIDSIESGDEIMTPLYRNRPAAVAFMTQWQSPFNPFFGDVAYKRRAMIGVIIDLIMLEDLHQQGQSTRSDLTCETMLRIAYVYETCKDVLPGAVKSAFETGMARIQERVDKWGPTGINGNMDFFGLVGNWYIWNATEDPRMKQIALDYAEKLLTDDRFFTEAGHAKDAGIADLSYEGITRFFLTWAALITDWPIMREAMEKSYRLKNLTSLQDPDGFRLGPSHMNARTAGNSAKDQWGAHFRDAAAAVITERALPWVMFPDEAELAGAPARYIARVTQVLNEPPYAPKPWWRKAFVGEVNYLIQYGPKDWYQKLLAMRDQEPERFKLPVLRTHDYITALGDLLVSARIGDFAAMVHVGDTSYYQGGGNVKSPWGFGGGQLSAFWSREAGTVILGLRRFAYKPAPEHDSYEEWRQWASHAASGLTRDGKVVSSIRIRDPKVQRQIDGHQSAHILFEGQLPATCGQQGQLMAEPMDYRREFEIGTDGVTITTRIALADHQPFKELYEIIPVFLYDANKQAPETATQIAWRNGNNAWQPASSDWAEDIAQIRLTRFDGAVVIRFARPQRVRLTRDVWQQLGGWMGNGQVRNILIDLQQPSDQGSTFAAREISYRIKPVVADEH